MVQKTELRCMLLMAIAILLLSPAALAQQPTTEKRCAFVSFNGELNAAMRELDAGKTALLVIYPLRINDPHGTYYIRDAASLQGRFNDIFPPAIRGVIATQKIDASDCKPGRFMYGNGDVWIALTDQGYAIEAVNVPGDDDRNAIGRVQVTCKTDGYRIIIDIGESETLRFRAWQNGHSLEQKPDTDLRDGKQRTEGTGACAYPIWTFNDAGKRVSVEGLGCFGDSNSPPPRATGQFIAPTGATSWCF